MLCVLFMGLFLKKNSVWEFFPNTCIEDSDCKHVRLDIQLTL